MATYEYTGRTSAGVAVQGRMESNSSSGVASELTSQGIIPLRIGIAEGSGLQFFEDLQRWRDRQSIGLTDVIMFCRQMTTLTRAGVPITRGLRGLSETLRNPEFGRILSDIADQLEKGHELASVLQRHPKIFSNLFVSVVHIGESSGRLEESFEQLYGYLSLEEETRKRVKSALRYPIMVFASIGVAVAVINMFVIPPFADLFKSFGADLPWATQILMSTSEWTTRYWHVGLAAILALAWGIRKWIETPEGRLAWHDFQLRLPKIGPILERALLARFCRTLAITLGAGLPVTQCLSVAARAVDNEHVGRQIIEMREDIEAGDTLTSAAHASRLFTPLVLQMMAVGEETGAVEDTLGEVASYYEREVDYDLRQIGDAIEPIMIVIVGVLVLGLALGVYLPMWEMASASRG